jgi:hypothetical protein
MCGRVGVERCPRPIAGAESPPPDGRPLHRHRARGAALTLRHVGYANIDYARRYYGRDDQRILALTGTPERTSRTSCSPEEVPPGYPTPAARPI